MLNGYIIKTYDPLLGFHSITAISNLFEIREQFESSQVPDLCSCVQLHDVLYPFPEFSVAVSVLAEVRGVMAGCPSFSFIFLVCSINERQTKAQL